MDYGLNRLKIVHTRELKNNAYVVPEEEYHVKIGSQEYFEILFDNNEFTELMPIWNRLIPKVYGHETLPQTN